MNDFDVMGIDALAMLGTVTTALDKASSLVCDGWDYMASDAMLQRYRDFLRFVFALVEFLFRVSLIVVMGIAYIVGCVWYLVEDDISEIYGRIYAASTLSPLSEGQK